MTKIMTVSGPIKTEDLIEDSETNTYKIITDQKSPIRYVFSGEVSSRVDIGNVSPNVESSFSEALLNLADGVFVSYGVADENL